MNAAARLLAVDYGHVRLGLAVGDPESKIASPLTTYARRNRQLDAPFFKKLCADEAISHIVVGLPVHLSGHEGKKAAEARNFGAWLAAATGLPVAYWDERFSTVEAEAHLASAGLTDKQRKARRDGLAAQIFLQAFLDAGCPETPVIQPLDGK